MKEGWAKIKDAAKYAGISESTFRKWLKQGLCHSRLLSGRILVQYIEIDAFLRRFAVDDNEVENIASEILQDLQ